MSDALPLPPRPSLDNYRKLAKDFRHADASGDPDAIRTTAEAWLERLLRLPDSELPAGARQYMARDLRRAVQNWPRIRGDGSLTAMQLFIARAHDFKSWRRFADHVRALEAGDPDVDAFEASADAIASGDIDKLRALLAARPGLARQRSSRAHRSTLLHYVSANGVEDFRQCTPRNIVPIANLLIDAGADVNAVSDAYGGNSTVLGLVATSYHPDAAGVQLELMQTLIDRGHRVDYGDIVGILRNGRLRAAQFLAARATTLGLAAAAGVGRLDAVKSWFVADGQLKPGADQKQLTEGFLLACQFGQADVVDFLLRQGAAADAREGADGPTGLHWAAFGGHDRVVEALLARNAPANLIEARHNGPPLGWALYGWHSAGRPPGPGFPSVVARLVRAGALLPAPEWFEEESGRDSALRHAQADSRMAAALRGPPP